MDEKEIDALKLVCVKEFGHGYSVNLQMRRGSVVIRKQNKDILPQPGVKLSGFAVPEKNTRLMEVNLKDDAAMEDFYLSSLRIWTAKMISFFIKI